MRLLGWWQVLLWVLGSPARGLEVAEEGSHLQSEEQPAHALLAGVVSTSEEEHPRGPGGQDRSAGEAGTVLGLDADGDHVLMLSVIPGETDDKLSSEPSGGTCGAQGEEDSRCSLREHLFSGRHGGQLPGQRGGVLLRARGGRIGPGPTRGLQ